MEIPVALSLKGTGLEELNFDMFMLIVMVIQILF
jgi:hypothetical protein